MGAASPADCRRRVGRLMDNLVGVNDPALESARARSHARDAQQGALRTCRGSKGLGRSQGRCARYPRNRTRHAYPRAEARTEVAGMITWFRDEAHRAYVYRVSTALIPALSGYGLVSDRVVPVIAAVVAA